MSAAGVSSPAPLAAPQPRVPTDISTCSPPTPTPNRAKYLTFLDNKAQAYDGSFPDENFAREVMQLFTIGLWKLHRDGTYALDHSGNPVMTYTNDDIVTFSRAWTGHSLQPSGRTNIENPDAEKARQENFIDPMRIHPEWRDALPKMDLHGGYLGTKGGVPTRSSTQRAWPAPTLTLTATLTAGDGYPNPHPHPHPHRDPHRRRRLPALRRASAPGLPAARCALLVQGALPPVVHGPLARLLLPYARRPALAAAPSPLLARRAVGAVPIAQ